MSDTLHDRIRAKVADTRRMVLQREWDAAGHSSARQPLAILLRLCDHADRILDRHNGLHACGAWHYTNGVVYKGSVASRDWCPEVRDLAEAWGVSE